MSIESRDRFLLRRLRRRLWAGPAKSPAPTCSLSPGGPGTPTEPCRCDRLTSFTYLLMPIAPGWSIRHQPPPPPPPPRHPLLSSHSVLGCSGHSGPADPLLFQLCFSVSPPTVARPVSLSLPLRVPGQGLACGAGCWLPEGVSDPAPLPLQYLLGHWFPSCSLPQISISDLLLPLNFVDAPQTGVEECLDDQLYISRVSDQNGVSLLYIILEMYHVHSGWEPSISSHLGRCLV